MPNFKFRRMLVTLTITGIFVAWSPAKLGAQAAATLSGRVTDPMGSAILAASVRLFHRLTGFDRTVSTDEQGAYSISNIPFQTYEIELLADGFQPIAESIALRSNLPAQRDFRLQIAAQRELIEINATDRLTLVDTEATGTRAELNRAVIERLPVDVGARGLESVLLSFPGFAANANGAIHPRGAHNQMTYVIDGMPISDQFTGSFATSIDPALVESLELYTGDIPAEYGSKVSGVASITTRSGLDRGGERFGQVELGGGRFNTLAASAQLGGTFGKKHGYFASVSSLKSSRFLDSPSFDNLHNGGNAERAFLRLDSQLGERSFLRFSAMTGRSSFQLANLRSQHAAGQRQRRLLRDAAGSIGFVRVLGPAATFDSTTSYRTTAAQLFPSAGDTPVTASLARHLSTMATLNRFNLLRGRHDLRFGLDYQRFPVSENFFFGLTDPGFNDPGGEEFNPNLLPHDLSRGGDWFRFSGTGTGNLYTAFVQDRIRLGRLTAALGARYDNYRFLVVGAQLQPRVGLAFHVSETGTVLRASYNRNYQTPPNENLLLANSQAAATLAPPEVRKDLSGGVILMRPQRQNVYEAGLQQRIGGWGSVDAVYFHKDSRDLQDNDNFLNTGVIFPTSLAQSNVNGFEARLAVPELKGFSGSLSLTHYHVFVTPPFTGGLFLGASALDTLSAGPFVIDHDQPLAVSASGIYRISRSWWTSTQARYDSGLVSNPSDPAKVAADPDYFDQLPFVDLLAETPRVKPRTIVDWAVGYEGYRGDERAWEIIFQVSNLTNKKALYNFQSVFVGTRVVEPRSVSARLRWYW